VVNNKGETPLLNLCFYTHNWRAAKCLVEKGIEVNIQNH